MFNRPYLVAGAVMIALGAAACVHEAANMIELHTALQQEYPGARIELGLVNGLNHLRIRFDSTTFHETPDAPLRLKGLEISRFALGHYADSTSLDSVTVEFVRESSRQLLSSSTEFTAMNYATGELRAASP